MEKNEKMKISFIAPNDWANVLTEYSHCLNKHSDDIESRSICFHPHTFNYNIKHDYDLDRCDGVQKQEAKHFIEESDIIIFGEEVSMAPTNYKILELCKMLGVDILNSNKKLCIWHPGSHYRRNHIFYNTHPLRHKIHKHLYGIDLYRLSNKESNDHPIHAYQYIDFSYDKFISNFKTKLKTKPWTILHMPSNTHTKGTNVINKVINNLNLDSTQFQYKMITNVPHSVSIKEKENSIFYIDQFWPQGAGGYGVSTLESLFASNVTFSTINNISDSMIKLTGKSECPVVSLGTSEEELYSTLNDFIKNTTESQLVGYMEDAGKWLDKCYSVDSVIKFFKNL